MVVGGGIGGGGGPPGAADAMMWVPLHQLLADAEGVAMSTVRTQPELPFLTRPEFLKTKQCTYLLEYMFYVITFVVNILCNFLTTLYMD